jgi:hypothetical protein
MFSSPGSCRTIPRDGIDSFSFNFRVVAARHLLAVNPF